MGKIKMKLSLFVSHIMVVSLLCSAFFFDDSEIDREKIADEITSKISKEIYQEKGLRLVGTGGGMMYGVRMMSMSFYYYNEVDLETARNLVIYCTEKYLKAINSDKRLRPFLVQYPFSEKNVEIRIFFRNPDGRDLPPGKIIVVESMNGKVEYNIYETGSHRISTLQEELYQEARKMVTAQNSN